MRRVEFACIGPCLSARGGDDRAHAALDESGNAEAGATKDTANYPRDASERDSGDGSVDAKIDGAHSGDGETIDAGRDSAVETSKWNCRESFVGDGVVCDCGHVARDRGCEPSQGRTFPGCSFSDRQLCHGLNGGISSGGGGQNPSRPSHLVGPMKNTALYEPGSNAVFLKSKKNYSLHLCRSEGISFSNCPTIHYMY